MTTFTVQDKVLDSMTLLLFISLLARRDCRQQHGINPATTFLMSFT